MSLTSNDPNLGKVKIGNGLIGTSAEQDIVEGSSVQIHAIAESGAQFQKWYDGNTNATRTVTVTEDMEFTAIFVEDEPDEEPEQETTFKLKLTSSDSSLGKVKIGNGSASASVEQDIVEGSSIQIHAIAESGGRFSSWSDGNTEETRTVTVTEDMEFQADFSMLF